MSIKTYSTILVDDEKSSLELLEWQIKKYCPQLRIEAVCNSPSAAITAIRKHEPDLVFLDIDMPQMNGFEMLQRLNPIDFSIIFTTAYEEFAVKAFKVNALDYLLKPIDINDLQNAVAKFEERYSKRYAQKSDNPNVEKKPVQKRIAITTTESLVFIEPDNIIYCESNSNYTFFHLNTPEKKMLVSKTLKDIEEILINYDFFRIHNSYLINMKHVKEFIRGVNGCVVMTNGDHLTVSRTRKEDFFETFARF